MEVLPMCNVCQCGRVDPCDVHHPEDECTWNDCDVCLMNLFDGELYD